jgi:hypothetical protein
MRWINRLLASGRRTVGNGAPVDAYTDTMRSSAGNRIASDVTGEANITEEIKRRQISLAVRYVTTLRAR